MNIKTILFFNNKGGVGKKSLMTRRLLRLELPRDKREVIEARIDLMQGITRSNNDRAVPLSVHVVEGYVAGGAQAKAEQLVQAVAAGDVRTIDAALAAFLREDVQRGEGWRILAVLVDLPCTEKNGQVCEDIVELLTRPGRPNAAERADLAKLAILIGEGKHEGCRNAAGERRCAHTYVALTARPTELAGPAEPSQQAAPEPLWLQPAAPQSAAGPAPAYAPPSMPDWLDDMLEWPTFP